jgi:YkoY family integral membrane protein
MGVPDHWTDMILADLNLWGQSLAWGDLAIVGLLVLLEGALSIDNALVLGLLAKRLPKEEQKQALTYGLVGAFVFRFAAVLMATLLLKWRIVKLVGGGYLVYIAIKHMFFEAGEDDGEVHLSAAEEPTLVHEATGRPLTEAEQIDELEQRSPLPVSLEAPTRRLAKFWPTVLVIELTDIAFAVDSILAAIGMLPPKAADHPDDAVHPKLWVVVLGGLLGVILMRFAAVIFIKLLERFPRFSTAAYVLVFVIGAKLLIDWGFNSAADPHRVDFHSPASPAFWIFWGAMAASFALGFLPKKRGADAS